MSWYRAVAAVEPGAKPNRLNCSSQTDEQFGASKSSSSSSAQSKSGSSGVPTRGLGSALGKRLVPLWPANPGDATTTRLNAAKMTMMRLSIDRLLAIALAYAGG